LVHRFPYPPDKGDRIRTFNIIRYLSQYCELSIATLADEPVQDAHIAELRRYCRKLAVVPIRFLGRWGRALCSFVAGQTITQGAFASPALRSVVRTWCRELRFDAVLASASSMVRYLRLQELRETRKVVDLIDVDSEKWFQYSASSRGPKRWLYHVEGHRLRRLERSLLGFANAVVLVSQAEADLYRRVCGDGPVYAVSNGVDLDYFTRPANLPPREPVCVFVGAMDYRPNVDGVLWFVGHVWPEVRQRHPDAIFYVVGRRPVPAISRLAARPGIVVTGTVSDVRPYLSRAAVVVAPLQLARGIQNKVLEAMAMRLPVVATREALTGLKVTPGDHVLQAITPRQWTDAITTLLTDSTRSRCVASAGRCFVERYASWSSSLAELPSILDLTTKASLGSQATEELFAASTEAN
jgi:sugar transferase (PEP-CTERM/EpsH1 system associated)